jgi:hypothetical protein
MELTNRLSHAAIEYVWPARGETEQQHAHHHGVVPAHYFFLTNQPICRNVLQ